MLGVEIEWAEELDLVTLGRPGERGIEVVGVEHTPKAVEALVARIAALAHDPAEVRAKADTIRLTAT